jgi:nitroimidazol reductase NimA-like FMN-containing flavoprotein (pyridoxamine 5'-phosphate oxidase superfamily)
MTTYSNSPELHTKPDRGHYDRPTIYAILDAAPICHVGFIDNGRPMVIPMLHGRHGDTLYLHGSHASRLLDLLASGAPACVEVALLDALVLGRSVCQHSVNFRSVVLSGHGRPVDDPDEKMHALRLITEQITPGRWAEARLPDSDELEATRVVAIAIEEAAAKIRSGPATGESAADLALPVWGGVLPLKLTAMAPEPDTHTLPNTPQPACFDAYKSP